MIPLVFVIISVLNVNCSFLPEYDLFVQNPLISVQVHAFHQLVRLYLMSFVFAWSSHLIESYQIHSLQWARSVLVYHLQARDICISWADQFQTMTASCLVFILFLINPISNACSRASRYLFPASDSRSLDYVK